MALVNIQYSKALYEFLVNHKKEDIIYQQLINGKIETLFLTTNMLIFKSPIISSTKKIFFLKELLKDFDKTIVDFIVLVLRSKRINFLKSIFFSFISLYDEKKGVKKVDIYVSKDLSEDSSKKIKKIAETLFVGPVYNFYFHIDSKFIGGFKLVSNFVKYDQTLKNKFLQVKRSISIN